MVRQAHHEQATGLPITSILCTTSVIIFCKTTLLVGFRGQIRLGGFRSNRCGFDTSAGSNRVAPEVVWLKLRAMREGGEIASRELFQRNEVGYRSSKELRAVGTT